MGTKPFPIELIVLRDLSPDVAAKVKHLDCAHYTNCLGIAAKEGWDQFSCEKCKSHVPVEMDITEVERLSSFADRILP